MSSKIKIILAVVVGLLVGVIATILLRPTSHQIIGGEGAGLGVPSGFDNVNLTGALQVGVSQGNPNAFSNYPVGSYYASNIGVVGGYELLNATGTTYQLAASDLLHSEIGFIATTTTTITFPGTSTLTTYLPNVGDQTTFVVYNASSTGGTITLAGGTGTTIQLSSASTTKNVTAGQTAIIDAIRTSAGTIDLLFSVSF